MRCIWTQYEHVVTPGGRDLERAPGVTLAGYVREVFGRHRGPAVARGLGPRNTREAAEEIDGLAQGAHPIYLDPTDGLCLRRAHLGQDQAREALALRPLGYRERAPYPP